MHRYHKRILKDINVSKQSKDYSIIVDDNNIDELYMIFTPQDGIYKGQTHIVHLKLKYGNDPDIYQYPVNPPLCTFVTPIWHCNIDTSGIICVDNLKSDNWISMMTIDNVYTTLILLLLEQNPDSPQNSKAGQQYSVDQNRFYEIARNYYIDNNGAGLAERYVSQIIE